MVSLLVEGGTECRTRDGRVIGQVGGAVSWCSHDISPLSFGHARRAVRGLANKPRLAARQVSEHHRIMMIRAGPRVPPGQAPYAGKDRPAHGRGGVAHQKSDHAGAPRG